MQLIYCSKDLIQYYFNLFNLAFLNFSKDLSKDLLDQIRSCLIYEIMTLIN